MSGKLKLNKKQFCIYKVLKGNKRKEGKGCMDRRWYKHPSEKQCYPDP